MDFVNDYMRHVVQAPAASLGVLQCGLHPLQKDTGRAEGNAAVFLRELSLETENPRFVIYAASYHARDVVLGSELGTVPLPHTDRIIVIERRADIVQRQSDDGHQY